MAGTSSQKKSFRERLSSSMRGKPKPPEQVFYGDILVLGMEKVGKTCIVNRLVNNYFTAKYVPTRSALMYDVTGLVQCEKVDKKEKEKKQMVFKKTFKKSVLGETRALKPRTNVKRVLTVTESSGKDLSESYVEGREKGLRELRFNVVDTPHDVHEMEPIYYEAAIANAKGFLLVCAFNVENSLEYIHDRFNEIKKKRNLEETPVLLIANKYDIFDKIWGEDKIAALAAHLQTKYCVTSVATKEGCEDMTSMMLNEINYFADEEAYRNSLPEDDAYYDENDEYDLGFY